MNPTPFLTTDSRFLDRVFRIALGDVVGNIGLQTSDSDGPPVLMAGLTYESWTRDAAINVWNGLPALFPDLARDTLLAEVDEQKLLRGQYWDAVVWVIGAWQHFLWTGDRDFLATAREVSVRWLSKMEQEELGPNGLFRGPACFQDGISGYADRYTHTGGSSCIADWAKANPDARDPHGAGLPMQCLSTNCLYFRAYELINFMDDALGQTRDPRFAESAEKVRNAIRRELRRTGSARFSYSIDPWGPDERQEGMGHAFTLLFGLAENAGALIDEMVSTPQGLPCLWPGYERYEGTVDGDRPRYGRHAGLIWPQVQAFWAEACAHAGRLEAAFREMQSMGEKAMRDGNFFECYHPDDGLPEGGVQEIDCTIPADWHDWCVREPCGELPGGPLYRWVSQPRTTWGATGFLRLVLHVCLGLRPGAEHLTFSPALPPGVNRMTLSDVRWRASNLHVEVVRTGAASFTLDGRAVPRIPAALTGAHQVRITI